MMRIMFSLVMMMCLLGNSFADEKKDVKSQPSCKMPAEGVLIEGDSFLKSLEREAEFIKQEIVTAVLGRDIHVQVNVQLIQVQNARGCYAIYSGLYTIYTSNQEFVRCLNIGDRIDVLGKIHVDTNVASSGAIYMFIYPAKITVIQHKNGVSGGGSKTRPAK